MITRPKIHLKSTGIVAAALVVAVLVAACVDLPGFSSVPGGSSGGTTAPASGCARPGLPTTVAYELLPGVAPNLTSLDVHAPASACHAPVVLWVHGGGYRTGDKRNNIADKARLFNGKGWILVSINYRLTKPGVATSAHYPDHYEDVAAAIRWVHDNVANYGGDPSRLALLGHSAGADIVSNIATNPAYLGHHGLALRDLRCAGPLDTAGFDKPSSPSNDELTQWRQALGNDPTFLTDTSATLLAKPGIGIPSTIGVVRGSASRQRVEQAFLAKLSSVGVHTTTIDARSLSHEAVNKRIGAPGDTVMTPPLVSFLSGCFA